MKSARLLGAFLLGVLALGTARLLFAAPPPAVHHHANFALFVDGERVDLSADRFMEDVAGCALDPGAIGPRERVHLHNNEDHVVHVHHGGVAWGHLFQNLGMSLGDRVLVREDGSVLAADSAASLKFVLNGRAIGRLAGEEIRSGDRVLVSFGSESVDEVLAAQYPQVAEDAIRYNEEADPASCSGHGPLTFRERLRAAFWR